jgi:murein DD-endopeptidase MepM/ murein hydrolase activator NlpD
LNAFNQIDTLTRKNPDSRGIITYDTYQILVASGEETVGQIANRLDINEEKLALYNGLISNYRPRKNEIIAIPDTQFISSSGWSTEITQQAIQDNSTTKTKVSLASNPLRHRVKQGETIYSLAREYNVSVNSLATWNGLGPDLDIKTGREIIIPAAAVVPRTTSKTAKKNSVISLQTKSLKTIETLKDELSKNESVTRKKDKIEIPSTLAQGNKLPATKIISVRPFITPVKGNIVSYYTQNKGSGNNNGVDYKTLPLETVRAVSNGTIVLISDIVGGNGKIILIRHQDNFITIYGRLTNVVVQKGQEVTQGLKIGEVIADLDTDSGLMHFEVRKGMKSIDPESMIR